MQRWYGVAALILWITSFGRILPGQNPAKVDYARDVQPIFRANCYGCHGPSQQISNLRLDRRRNAMPNRVGSNGATIVPGNSARSRLYLKVSGSQAGLQMPPTGPLSKEEISTLKVWIDQGAEWPDELAGDGAPSIADPRATRMMEALRNGDSQQFRKMVKDDPPAVNLKGPSGNTPLMYAALYGDADSVKLLLEHGADPNLRNDAHATALTYAVRDLDKTRLLLEHQSDPNVRSDEGRTPLAIAAAGLGSSAVIKLLLDHGADPGLKAPAGAISPLNLGLLTFDEATLRMLLNRGANFRPYPLVAALRAKCAPCVDLLVQSASPVNLTNALTVAARTGDTNAVHLLVERGADVNGTVGGNLTVLMSAVSAENASTEIVKTLLEHGAAVNAKNLGGETALDLAKQQGKTQVLELLLKSGAKEGIDSAPPATKPKSANSVRAAVERSLPLLQRTDVVFFRKAGCVSCHNNSLTAMTIVTARKSGFTVDEEVARKQLEAIGTYMESWRERVLEGDAIPGGLDTVSYILLGMAVEKYTPDTATDAMARYLASRQSNDGRWAVLSGRPPLEMSDFEGTAVTLRTLQAFAPKSQRPVYDRAIQLGAAWLAKAEPATNEDRTFQLLGLQWSGAEKSVIGKAGRGLLSEQRPDGGWAQLRSLESDAYATGQALVALRETGQLAVTDPAYRRGVQFLLNSQFEDGSWHVKTRSVAIQPYFDSEFPYGRDQFISAAATNWATMALAPAAR